VVEREPTAEHRAGAGRQVIGLGGQAPAGDRGTAVDQISEPLGTSRDDLERGAQARERKPLAIGLLPAEPTVAGEPGSEHGGRRIGKVDLDRGAGQQPAALVAADQDILERIEGAGGVEARLDQPSGRDLAIATSPVRAISISP
jgi:hypothetical protein